MAVKNVAFIAYTEYLSDPRVRREAEALAASGHLVTVFCLESHLDYQQYVHQFPQISLFHISVRKYRGDNSLLYVKSYTEFFIAVFIHLHKNQAFDVVHVHTMPDFLIFSALRYTSNRRFKRPIILDMHDLMPDLYRIKFGLPKNHPIIRALYLIEKSAMIMADHIIVVHEFQKNILMQRNANAKKIITIMNSPDERIFTYKPHTQHPLRFVYHGTLLYRYGLDIALKAFALTVKHFPMVQFLILGGGDYFDELKNLAKTLDIENNVILNGITVPVDKIPSLLQSNDIGIIAYRDDNEDSALPTKLLEYLQMGIVCISAKTRCIRAHFDEDSLCFFEPGNIEELAQKMILLLQNSLLRDELRKKGFVSLQPYRWEFQKEKLLQLYSTI